MTHAMPKSKSRKVNGYVKAVVALEALTKKRDERYERYVRALDVKRDRLAVEVAARRRALTGGQSAEAGWILGARTTIATIKDGGVRYAVSRQASLRGGATPGRAAASRGAEAAAEPIAAEPRLAPGTLGPGGTAPPRSRGERGVLDGRRVDAGTSTVLVT